MENTKTQMVLETRHYYRVPYEITDTVKFKQMKNTSQVLYFNLCRIANDCADHEGWFYHSLADLAHKSGLERRSVIHGKRELEANGFIDVQRSQYVHNKTRACNYYRINGFSFRVKKK